MKIENAGIRATADYDVGINLIQSVRQAQSKITNPGFEAVFAIGGKPFHLRLGKPDAVQQDGHELKVIFSHKIGGMANNRVQVEIKLSCGANREALMVRAKIENITNQDIYLDHVKLLDVDAGNAGELQLGHGHSEWSFYKHGYQSFSASGTLRVDQKAWRPRFRFLRLMEENVSNPNPRTAGDFISEWVSQITNRTSGHTLLVGFVQGAGALGDIRLRMNHRKGRFEHLSARCHFDGVALSPGDSRVSEPLMLMFGSRSRNLLTYWADVAGKRMNARVNSPAPSGWCSWYYYYTKINEDEMLGNLSKLTEMNDELAIDYVQVDDGYQSKIGDWLSVNKRFNSGMEDMAHRIANAGFYPGIWTAPFYARPNSKLFREHRDWFLRDKKGKLVSGGFNPLWGGKVYCLDPTHPGTQGYLRQVYTSLREMGYRVFKCDFLYAASIPGARHNPHTTRAESLRIGLEIIRESIGDDAFLLGCGCPILPAVGLVDGMRIGMDVTPFWENRLMKGILNDHNALCTKHSIVNTINRAFMHNRLFVNDPDCLLVRKDKNRMTLNQVRALATAVALSGGLFVISDNMNTITKDRLNVIKTAMKYRCSSMEVVGMHNSFEPELLIGRSEKGLVFGFFNFTSKPVNKIFDLKDLMTMEELGSVQEIRDIWEGRELKHQNGLLRIGKTEPNSAHMILVALY